MEPIITSIHDIARKVISIADIEAKKSSCKDKKVGAILFDFIKGNIIGRGHNDASTPCLTCIKDSFIWKQDGCCAIHAEVNAIFDYFKRYGYKDEIKNAIMICTNAPCDQCVKYMINFGIQIVLYDKPYHCDYKQWVQQIVIERFNRKEVNFL